MSDQPQFTSIPAVKAAFKAEGDNWFDKGTMEWWHSKIESDLIGGQFFITSEQREPDTERKFSVRKVIRAKAGNLSVDTIGEFHSHETLAQARQALDEVIQNDQQ
jgi:hypothetical protein